MKRRIIAYKNYYKDFFESLDEGTQQKILYGIKEINKALKLKSEYEARKKQGDF